MNESAYSKNINSRSWLDRLSNALLREPKDREQLLSLLRDAEDRQLLDANALAMIEGVLQVSEMQVRDIMIPRSQMVTVQENAPFAEFLPQVVDSGHSRFPVVGDNRDEVVGILLAKDLLRFCSTQGDEAIPMRDVMRPTQFVPESKRLDVLLHEFRHNRNHIAIVIDEYGGVSGLVTIEDVLEQIVGEIEDEYDVDEETHIKRHSECEYIIKAITSIEDFNDYFGDQLDDEAFDTIGGLVLHAFGHVPKRNETIHLNAYEFKILNADNRRIHLLQLRLKNGVTDDADDEPAA